MDREAVKKQAQIFKNARGNLMLAIAFTIINLIMLAAEADFSFLFSITMPQVAYVYFGTIAQSVAVGLLVAFIGVGLYFMFWILSKKIRAFMLVALIVFSVDTFIFFMLLVETAFDVTAVVHLAFLGWVLFYLIMGTVAWSKLRLVHPYEMELIFAELNDKNAQNTQAAQIPPQPYQQMPQQHYSTQQYQQLPPQYPQQPQYYQQPQQYQQLPPQYPQQPYQQPQEYYQQQPQYSQQPQYYQPAPPENTDNQTPPS